MKVNTPGRRMSDRIDRALNRLRTVFIQIPGARLSLAEAARLTELETHLCQILLNALEDLDFLRQEDGFYQRQSNE
jgi:hypothetical protein